MQYFVLETSGLSGENVQESFNLLASSLIYRIDNGELDPSTLATTIIKATLNEEQDEKCLC